jgi:hypothetical protein
MRRRDPPWGQTLTIVAIALCAACAGAACAMGIGSDNADNLDGSSPEESAGEASFKDQTANTDALDGTSPEGSAGEASLEDQTASTDAVSTGEGSAPTDALTESANPDASRAGESGDAMSRDAADAMSRDAGDAMSRDAGDAMSHDAADAMSGDAGDAISGDATPDSLPAPSDGQPTEAESPTCQGVEILCNGACVDPTLDPNHCGACGVVCKSGLCGTTVSAPMTSSPADWTFNGSAVWSALGPSAQMTAAGAAGAIGTAIYQHAIVTDAFTVSFQFRIGANGGGRYDGMGFMIESTGPMAIGSGNGGLGMGGLTGYGVEFDVYNNGQCGDVSDDQVGVDSLAFCNSSPQLPTSLFASPDLTSTINLADGQWHQASVTLASGAMSVTVGANNIAKNVALPGFTPGTSYYYGFSGATGGLPGNGGMQTEVKSVTMMFPTPRCL